MAPRSPGDPTDPGTAPIPVYDYNDPGKSFLVGLDFHTTTATLVDAQVGSQRSYSHLGDPPLLKLRLLNADGSERSQVNSWDPRWVFVEGTGHDESMVMMDRTDTLTMPFDADGATLVVDDQQAGSTLTTVDLRPAVHDYCSDNPTAPECLVADLAVTTLTTSAPPLGLVGTAVTVTLATTVANLGPDTPVDASGSITATGDSGLTVTPGSYAARWPALATGSPQDRTDTVQATCTKPGTSAFSAMADITPDAAKVIDPVASNNQRTSTLTLTCAIPVQLNVRPGETKNQVNVNSGVLPMAILSTGAEYGLPLPFDATTIDAGTLRFGTRDALLTSSGGAPEAHGRIHPEDSYEPDDKTKDGDLDAVVHARSDRLGLTPATTELCVRGLTTSGVPFFGCDHVVPR
ncbi:hypothetical protein BN13_230008 [Nostocoides jenkinsii Ben 74]|uniref:DUF11 domain-containing protein n=1 Tax=Nostocoides jenkinsii Ben 74 TaxID=1193518 RepID=A0A077MAK2_9MICO|nr:hypothetical protein BN13_230008 [Tetrasphaera jenkinsii Ben 74]